MSLSYYEIVVCGTAHWKLLDLPVFAQSLLINSSLNDRVCPVQTTHVSDERVTQREESQLDQRASLPQSYYYLQSADCLFRDRISCLFWLDGAKSPYHLSAPLPCCSHHLCCFFYTDF